MTVLDDDAELATHPIEDRVLGKADIDARYDELRKQVADPSHGLFGPDSMMWRMVDPLPVLPYMLVQAGLIEGAVPKIWFGTEYSVTRSGDYVSRYARSYDAFADWFLGDLETALRRGRKIHGYHSRVGGVAPHDAGHVRAGQEYRATEQDLLLFTVGTQIVPIKQCYELLCGPLTDAEAEAYWAECRTFCALFGIDPDVIPTTWNDFEAYWEASLHSGEMEAPCEGFSRYGPLADPSELTLGKRIMTKWTMAAIFNLMPDHLRRQFALTLPVAVARPKLTAATCILARWTIRLLPGGLTRAPRARAALRRVGREGDPGRLGRWLATQLRAPFGEAQPSLTTPMSPEADPERSQAFRRSPV